MTLGVFRKIMEYEYMFYVCGCFEQGDMSNLEFRLKHSIPAWIFYKRKRQDR